MADKQIGILIEADADLSAINQSASALDDFAASGGASLETLKKRTADLATSTVALRKELVDNTAAQNGLNAAITAGNITVAQAAQMQSQLAARAEEVTVQLKAQTAQHQLAKAELSAMSAQERILAAEAKATAAALEAQAAAQAAATAAAVDAIKSLQPEQVKTSASTRMVASEMRLLSQEMGVTIPGGAGRMLAQFPLIQQGMQLAFTPAIVGLVTEEIIKGYGALQLYSQELDNIGVSGFWNQLNETMNFGTNKKLNAQIGKDQVTESGNKGGDIFRNFKNSTQASLAQIGLTGPDLMYAKGNAENEKLRQQLNGQLAQDAINLNNQLTDAKVAQYYLDEAKKEAEAAKKAKQAFDLLIANQGHAADDTVAKQNLTGMSAAEQARITGQQNVADIEWSGRPEAQGGNGMAGDPRGRAILDQLEKAAADTAQAHVDAVYQTVADEQAKAANATHLDSLSGAAKIRFQASQDIMANTSKMNSQLGLEDALGPATDYSNSRQAKADQDIQALYASHQSKINEIAQQGNESRTNSTLLALAKINDQETKSMDEYAKLYAKDEITYEQYQQAKSAIAARAGQEEQKVIVDLGGQLMSLYDSTIGKAKTFGDAMKNIWGEVMNYWKREAFNAFAAIILGMSGPAGLSGGSGSGKGSAGGILGGLLGGIFGGGGNGVSGVPSTAGGSGVPWGDIGAAGGGLSTPTSGAISGYDTGGISMIDSAAAASIGGTPWNFPGAGGGAGSSGMPNTGVIPGVGGSGMSGLLGMLAKNPGLGATLGLGGTLGSLIGSKFSNPFARAGAMFGGIAGIAGGAGALAGLITGTGAFSGALASLGIFFTNPWTVIPAAVIAAIFGLSGLFGNGQSKVDASKIADQGFAQIKSIEEQYKNFQVDYPTGINNMNTVWNQMVSQWQAIGGSVGSNSIQDQGKYYQQYLTAMQAIYASRQARSGYAQSATASLPTSTLVNGTKGLPLPEFAQGGPIPGAGSPGVMVVAHPGEYVMNRAAVQRVGRETLQSMNHGNDGGGFSISKASLRQLLAEDPTALDKPLLVWLRGSSKSARVLR